MPPNNTHAQSQQPIGLQRPDMSGYRPPNSPIAGFFWRWKMWVGGTFATSMLEPWETFVLRM